MSEKNEKPKKEKDKVTEKDVWKPDDTQMVQIWETLAPTSLEKRKEKEKAKNNKASE